MPFGPLGKSQWNSLTKGNHMLSGVRPRIRNAWILGSESSEIDFADEGGRYRAAHE